MHMQSLQAACRGAFETIGSTSPALLWLGTGRIVPVANRLASAACPACRLLCILRPLRLRQHPALRTAIHPAAAAQAAVGAVVEPQQVPVWLGGTIVLSLHSGHWGRSSGTMQVTNAVR